MRRLMFLAVYGLSLFCASSVSEASNFLTNDTPDFSAFKTTQAADTPIQEHDPVTVTLIAEERGIQPGRAFWLGIKINLEKDWHTYWKNSGDSGMPTSIEWQLPAGFEVDSIDWPAPERFIDKSLVSFGYSAPFVLLAKITPANNVTSGQNVEIGATVRWVACNEGNCLPGDSRATITLPVSKTPPSRNTTLSNTFSQAREQLPQNNWKVEGDVGHNMVRLAVIPPEEKNNSYALAYFVPSDPDFVNYHQSLEVIRSPNGDGFTLNLRRNPAKALPSYLNGVLYLNPGVGARQNGTAVAIHAPLREKTIAMANGNDAAVAAEGEEVMTMDFEGGIALAIAMAFIGGIILNLMPCVLPVISLKVLSIVKMSGKHRLTTIKHGATFTLGVLVSFWILAGSLLMLQAYGHAVGWGFQLQEPIFVAILAAVLLVFALSLFGVFEIGTGMASWAGHAEHHNTQQATGLASSFFNGILATAVATPCTGPFLGSALGFAVTLPPLAAMSVFTALGLGVAFPYLVLTSFPSLVKWLPKPGNWMVTFKQLMGFLLLATNLWLIWVFGAQTDNFGVFLLLSALFILAIACWTYGQWCTPMKSRRVRKLGLLATCFFALVGSYFLVISAELVPENNEKALASHLITGQEDPRAWLPFTPQTVEQFREEGKPVFIDFTAKWCVICQTNHMVLLLDDLEKRFEDLGIVKFKADWTRPDPAITKELRKFGRNGVPLYLLYAPGATTPMVLPQVLTPDVVNGYLDKLQETAKNSSGIVGTPKQKHSVANP